MIRRLVSLPCMMSVALALAHGPASSQTRNAPVDRTHEAELGSSPAAKCARYAQAWQEATARRPMAGIGSAFRTRHDAFLASGCQTPPDVCPRSKEELELANTLVLLGMSRKLASTFFPFKCGS